MQGYRVKRWHFEFTAALVKFNRGAVFFFPQPAVKGLLTSETGKNPAMLLCAQRI